MSRAKWGGIMVLALGATAGAGYFFYMHAPTQGLTMEPVNVPVPVSEPIAESTGTTEAPAPEAPIEKATVAIRNILFRFPRASAKSVFIVGDFNEWKRQPLTKTPKGWEISLALAPGDYNYLYVVEDKRIKDPNNKSVKDGKSVIKVKPLLP